MNDAPSRPLRIAYRDWEAVAKRRNAQWGRPINISTEEVESEEHYEIEIISNVIVPPCHVNGWFGFHANTCRPTIWTGIDSARHGEHES